MFYGDKMPLFAKIYLCIIATVVLFIMFMAIFGEMIFKDKGKDKNGRNDT
jgi:hypothetical protein